MNELFGQPSRIFINYLELNEVGWSGNKDKAMRYQLTPVRMVINKISCCCSVAKLCLTLFNPMNCSMPGFPVHHQILELAQTHVH